MTRPNRYPQELRERAVRMVIEHRGEHPSEWAAMCAIASKFGMMAETLRIWVRRAEVDGGKRPGVTSKEKKRLRQLERENRELRRANEFSKSRVSFFCAGARPATAQAVTFIHTHRDRWGIEPICRVLSFAPATYHAAISRPPSARRVRHEALKPEITRVFGESSGVRCRQGLGAVEARRDPRGAVHRGAAHAGARDPRRGAGQVGGSHHHRRRDRRASGRSGGSPVPRRGPESAVGRRSDLCESACRLRVRLVHHRCLLAVHRGVADVTVARRRSGAGRPGDGHLGPPRGAPGRPCPSPKPPPAASR